MDDCIFCKIIEGVIPSKKVFENEDLVAFEDLNPVAPVHVLLVPKRHFANLYEMSSTPQGLETLNSLYKALPELVRACGLESKGFRLINNCGENAGQTVMHVHFHLVGGIPLGPRII
ncbi:MAG: histidine triad nucleotide-binding protein [Clostridiaceae bacterium]|nr:histidine triad nucleotide-binding protein [Clostridiaceae bacterium]